MQCSAVGAPRAYCLICTRESIPPRFAFGTSRYCPSDVCLYVFVSLIYVSLTAVCVFIYSTLLFFFAMSGVVRGPAGSNDCRIYVGNLPPDIRTKDVEDVFYKYGAIRDIDLKNRRGGPPFAFVEFEDPR